MKRNEVLKTALALLALAMPGAPALAAERVRVLAGVAFDVSSIDFSQSSDFQQYAETGHLESQYTTKSGVGGELGVHFRFTKHLGAMLSGSSVSRDSSVSVSATVPHPFFLNQPRSATGDKTGLKYKETTARLDLVYAFRSGPVEIFLFAGPALVKVETDLVSNVTYRDVYPYDEVAVSTIDVAKVSDNPVGFSGGGGLDWRISDRFGLGAAGRFTSANAKLAPPDGPTIDVDAGGFQATVGIRVFF
jgi:opacity protein-like surface antigen